MFSGLNLRLLAFVSACLMVAFTLAVPVRALWRTHGEMQQIEQQIAEQQTAIDQLKATQARLKDKAYLQTLIRSRLNYVYPGEVGFIVLDKETSTQIDSVPGALVPNAEGSWYSRLWASTKLADAPAKQNDPLVVSKKPVTK